MADEEFTEYTTLAAEWAATPVLAVNALWKFSEWLDENSGEHMVYGREDNIRIEHLDTPDNVVARVYNISRAYRLAARDVPAFSRVRDITALLEAVQYRDYDSIKFTRDNFTEALLEISDNVGYADQKLKLKGEKKGQTASGRNSPGGREELLKQRRSSDEVDALLAGALTKHHGYEAARINTFEPMPNSALLKETTLADGTLGNALSRAFASIQGTPYQKYKEACRRQTPLAHYLIKANGDELPDRKGYELRDSDGNSDSHRRHGKIID